MSCKHSSPRGSPPGPLCPRPPRCPGPRRLPAQGQGDPRRRGGKCRSRWSRAGGTAGLGGGAGGGPSGPGHNLFSVSRSGSQGTGPVTEARCRARAPAAPGSCPAWTDSLARVPQPLPGADAPSSSALRTSRCEFIQPRPPRPPRPLAGLWLLGRGTADEDRGTEPRSAPAPTAAKQTQAEEGATGSLSSVTCAGPGGTGSVDPAGSSGPLLTLRPPGASKGA